ncbi:MAG: hypothetical protein ACOH5I_15115 [Oligoflexus sp.]
MGIKVLTYTVVLKLLAIANQAQANASFPIIVPLVQSEFTIKVVATVKLMKIESAIAFVKPIRLSAYCGDELAAEDKLLMYSEDEGNTFDFLIEFEPSKLCDLYEITFESPGVKYESLEMTHDFYAGYYPLQHQLELQLKELNAKKIDAIKAKKAFEFISLMLPAYNLILFVNDHISETISMSNTELNEIVDKVTNHIDEEGTPKNLLTILINEAPSNVLSFEEKMLLHDLNDKIVSNSGETISFNFENILSPRDREIIADFLKRNNEIENAIKEVEYFSKKIMEYETEVLAIENAIAKLEPSVDGI